MWYPYPLPIHPLQCHPLPCIFVTFDEKPLQYDPQKGERSAWDVCSEDKTLIAEDVACSDKDYLDEDFRHKSLSDLNEEKKPPEHKPINRRSFLERVTRSSEDALTGTMRLKKKVQRLTKGAKKKYMPKRRFSKLPSTGGLISKQLMGHQISEAWNIVESRKTWRRKQSYRWWSAGGSRKIYNDRGTRRVAGELSKVIDMRRLVEEDEMKLLERRLYGVWLEGERE